MSGEGFWGVVDRLLGNDRWIFTAAVASGALIFANDRLPMQLQIPTDGALSIAVSIVFVLATIYMLVAWATKSWYWIARHWQNVQESNVEKALLKAQQAAIEGLSDEARILLAACVQSAGDLDLNSFYEGLKIECGEDFPATKLRCDIAIDDLVRLELIHCIPYRKIYLTAAGRRVAQAAHDEIILQKVRNRPDA